MGSGEWVTLSMNLPVGMQSAGLAEIAKEKVILFGGWAEGNKLKQALEIDLTSKKIEAVQELPEADLFTSSDLCANSESKDQIFAIGKSYLYSMNKSSKKWQVEFAL